ncbi:MAG: FHA domain-containing protein [Armatimonadetes bacterium]|nr:FHA domain-containing protein [Armatimonadota bacterium]
MAVNGDRLYEAQLLAERFRDAVCVPDWDRPKAKAASLQRQLAENLGALLPPELTSRLGPPMTLRVPPADPLPWELALWPGAPLAREGQRGPASPPGERTEVLLLSDPDGTLPWTLESGGELEELLSSSFRVVHYKGATINQSTLLEALASPRLRMVRLAASVGTDSFGRRGWLHLEGALLSLDGLQEVLRSCPPLVFLELYSSTPPRALVENTELWAGPFLAAGAQTVVTRFWDEPFAGWVVRETCRALLEGNAIGPALQAARRKLLAEESDDPYLSAHAYLIYGDPAQAMAPATAARERTSRVGSLLSPEYRLRFLEGPDAGRVVPLFARTLVEGQPVYLGGPGVKRNDVMIEDDALDNRLVSLERAGTGLLLRNWSHREAVLVNGLGVGHPILLNGGETIQLSSTRIVFERPAGSGAQRASEGTAEAPRYFLQVVEGSARDLGRSFPVGSGAAIAGRLPECAIPLHDPAVSRQQFLVMERDGEYFLTHLGSSPTVINGIPADRERELRHGDLIQVSEHTALRFTDSRREKG